MDSPSVNEPRASFLEKSKNVDFKGFKWVLRFLTKILTKIDIKNGFLVQKLVYSEIFNLIGLF